ncbi:UNVERIFIED_CONTAM: hypothetical protein FKN15_018606 [Acipenser sinensis]
MALRQGKADDAPGKVTQAGNRLHSLTHPSQALPILPLPHGTGRRVAVPSVQQTEQMEKIWAAVYHQGTVLAKLLRERSTPPTPLGPHMAASINWPQVDILSITAFEEVGKQQLAFPSEKVETESMSLSAELILLIKRATTTRGNKAINF